MQKQYKKVGYELVNLIDALAYARNNGRYGHNQTGEMIDKDTANKVDLLVQYIKENY